MKEKINIKTIGCSLMLLAILHGNLQQQNLEAEPHSYRKRMTYRFQRLQQ